MADVLVLCDRWGIWMYTGRAVRTAYFEKFFSWLVGCWYGPSRGGRAVLISISRISEPKCRIWGYVRQLEKYFF